MQTDELIVADGAIIERKTIELDPVFRQVQEIRDLNGGVQADWWHIGRIPAILFHAWLREAGVAPDDPAAEDVLRRKILSGEFERLRPKSGTF